MPLNEDFRDEVRSDIARQVLASALIRNGEYLLWTGREEEDLKQRARQLTKGAVALADMLLEELENAQARYEKAQHDKFVCICSEDAGGLRIPFDPKCPQHGKGPIVG